MKRRKLTHEEYVEQLNKINSKIIPIEEYNGMYAKTLHQCLECNHQWKVRPYNILIEGNGCPKCAYKRKAHSRALTQEEYINRITKLSPNIMLIGEYINNATPTKHRCEVCGYGSNGEWLPRPSHIMNGHGCPVCSGNIIGSAPGYKNSIWAQEEYREFFGQYLTEEQMKSHMPNSHTKIDAICLYCGRHKQISPNTLLKQGFGCICDDGVSYPNKFMFSFLEQAHIDFIRECSFDWSDNKIYDFYIPSCQCIIECHGRQHYLGWDCDNNNRIEQQNNDDYKMNIALEHGIKPERYIVVNCSQSNKQFIKANIEKSGMLDILNIDIQEIDFNKCREFALNNMIKQVCNMWNNGLSVKEIQNKTQIVTVYNYLKIGNQLGWCDNYTNQESRKRSVNRGIKNARTKQMYCLEMNKVFESQTSAAQELRCNAHAIYLCCIGKWRTYKNMHWYYLYDTTKKDGTHIDGAITLGLISEEDALKQLNYYLELQ